MKDLQDSNSERKRFSSDKFDLMDAIIFSDELKPVEKLVAITLIQHLGPGKSKCWPSEKRIAKLIGDVSVRTVQRALDRLVELGLFSRTPRDGTSNMYTWIGQKKMRAVLRDLLSYKAGDDPYFYHPDDHEVANPHYDRDPNDLTDEELADETSEIKLDAEPMTQESYPHDARVIPP
jgi:hypothetical protein